MKFITLLFLYLFTLAAGLAEIERLETALAAAQGQPPSPSTDLLAEMDAEFSLLHDAVQAAFAAPWATVRVLVQAGKQSLAHAYVDSLAVPDDLLTTKAAILAKLAP